MGDSQRENAWFSLKWGIFEEKTRDFRLNGGFAKTRDFRLNGGFAKRKRVIFAYIGDSRRENALILLKWGILEEKTRDFHLNGGFSKRKRVIFT